MPHRWSRSRFSRRLHRISEWFLTLFLTLGETWKVLNERSSDGLDSYPIAACDNDRIPRCKRYQGEAWRGISPAKSVFPMAFGCIS